MIDLITPWKSLTSAFEDDISANVASMLKRTKQPYTLVTLQLMPHLRHQLEQINQLEMPWWNVYDAIADIPIQDGIPLAVEDLDWPENAEFVPGTGAVLVYVQGVRYAKCTYTPDDYLDQVTRYDSQGQPTQIDQFDDRGFLSWRRDLQPTGEVQTLFNAFGDVVLTKTDADGITVAPGQQRRFRHAHYDAFQPLLDEFTAKRAHQQAETFTILVYRAGFNYPSTQVLALTPYDILVGSGESRVTYTDDVLHRMTSVAHAVIATDMGASRAVQRALADWALLLEKPLRLLSPYSSRLALGHSNELSQLVIYWRATDLVDAAQEVVTRQILTEMLSNDAVVLLASTDDNGTTINAVVQQFVDDTFNVAEDHAAIETVLGYLDAKDQQTLTREQADELDELKKTENWDQVTTAAKFLRRIHLRGIDDHKTMWAALDEARLLLDLSPQIDPFIQLAAISTGVPQLVRAKTEYVTTGKNGLVIHDLNEVGWGLAYFLDGLRRWNESLVYSVAKMERFSDERLIERWQEVMTDADN